MARNSAIVGYRTREPSGIRSSLEADNRSIHRGGMEIDSHWIGVASIRRRRPFYTLAGALASSSNEFLTEFATSRSSLANLLVRTRARGDIDCVFPDATVRRDEQTDYRFRASVLKRGLQPQSPIERCRSIMTISRIRFGIPAVTIATSKPGCCAQSQQETWRCTLPDDHLHRSASFPLGPITTLT
jgi:hypothetical protein